MNSNINKTRITSFDADKDQNAVTEYKVFPSNAFTISSLQGVIRLIPGKQLDFEKENMHMFQVKTNK